MKPLVGTAPDETSLSTVTEAVRERVAFYLSTPAYRRVFELHGWQDEADRAATFSKAGRWSDLASLVDDTMLHTVATIGTHQTIASQLRDRYGPRVDRIEFSIPIAGRSDAETFARMLAELRGS